MSDPTIRKLYNLDQADLSYFICELVFATPKERSEVARYYAEVTEGTRAIVKTYGHDQQENGSAFVIKQHFKNIKEYTQKNYFTDAVNLIVVADQGAYVDVRQFDLADLFPTDRYSLTCVVDQWNCINLFDQDYKHIKLKQGNEDPDYKFTVISYNSNPTLMKAESERAFTEIYKDKAPILAPQYLKATSRTVDVGFARFLSKTRQPGGGMDQTTALTMTFIPIEKAQAWLVGK